MGKEIFKRVVMFLYDLNSKYNFWAGASSLFSHYSTIICSIINA